MWYTVCLRVCFLNTGQVALCWCEALFMALVYVGGSIDQSSFRWDNWVRLSSFCCQLLGRFVLLAVCLFKQSLGGCPAINTKTCTSTNTCIARVKMEDRVGGQRFVSMFVCTPGSVLFCEAPHSFLFIYFLQNGTKLFWSQFIMGCSQQMQ